MNRDFGAQQRYICSICNEYHTRTFSKLLSHIRYLHSHDPGFSIACGIEGCQKVYRIFSSYETHLRRKHGGFEGLLNGNPNPVQKAADDNSDEQSIQNSDHSDIDDNSSDDQEDFNDEQFAKLLAKVILNIRERQKLSTKAVQNSRSKFV